MAEWWRRPTPYLLRPENPDDPPDVAPPHNDQHIQGVVQPVNPNPPPNPDFPWDIPPIPRPRLRLQGRVPIPAPRQRGGNQWLTPPQPLPRTVRLWAGPAPNSHTMRNPTGAGAAEVADLPIAAVARPAPVPAPRMRSLAPRNGNGQGESSGQAWGATAAPAQPGRVRPPAIGAGRDPAPVADAGAGGGAAPNDTLENLLADLDDLARYFDAI